MQMVSNNLSLCPLLFSFGIIYLACVTANEDSFWAVPGNRDIKTVEEETL